MVELANAKPDGHTLGMVTVELAMFPHQANVKTPIRIMQLSALRLQLRQL